MFSFDTEHICFMKIETFCFRLWKKVLKTWKFYPPLPRNRIDFIFKKRRWRRYIEYLNRWVKNSDDVFGYIFLKSGFIWKKMVFRQLWEFIASTIVREYACNFPKWSPDILLDNRVHILQKNNQLFKNSL